MTDLELMQQIHTMYHEQLAAATQGTAIPEAFLGALVANESGGNPSATRFEHVTLWQIWETLVGRRQRFGKISTADLLSYATGLTANPVSGVASFPPNVFHRIDELATSFGLTQIMGYHILEWTSVPLWCRTVDDLASIVWNLRSAVMLLTLFANEFSLDLGQDFEKLLRCWNTGRPDGATFSPLYVPNGLARMDLYRSIESGGNTGGTT